MQWHVILLATIIGGLIAGISGLALDLVRERRREKRLKELYAIIIRDDLERAISIYDRIFNDYEKTKTIWFHYLDEWQMSRAMVDRHQENIIFFGDNIRRKILSYYVESAQICSALRNTQNAKYEKGISNEDMLFLNNFLEKKALETKSLRAKAEGLLEKLK